MRNAQRRALSIGLVVATAAALVGCQSLDGPTGGGDGDTTLTVGFITPLTGGLAAFGAPDTFVVEQMQAWFDEHPIEAGGVSYDVEILLEDSQSSPDRAAQVAQDLITQDGADVLLAHATPETTVPVSNQCEANAIPCITADTPWQPWFFSRQADPANPEPLKWSYHFFWGLEDIAAVYQDIWSQVDTNKRVAGLFPNDSDGVAWSGALPGMFEAAGNGYVLNTPTLYEPGTQDFSAIIAAFKANGDEILTGVLPPPDFATFWQQAQQQGYQPEVVSIAKAIEFPAAAEALGNPVNFTTEVWWSPESPFTSNLTGQTAAELAEAYETASGSQWSVVLGFSEALFEVLEKAVVDAGGIEPQALVDALSTMKIDTIVGPLDWTSGPVPNVAKTPLVGGQWAESEGGEFPFELGIVSNSEAPQIPTVGTVNPMAY
jgi:branched-chain amino acid transport system substrate-binding protein